MWAWSMLVLCLALAGCGGPDEPGSAPADEALTAPATELTSADEAAIRVERLAGYNVAIVVVDGLRADRVTPESMPFLAEFARRGWWFEDAAANSSHVTQSLASFFTGRLPTAGGTIGVYEAEPHDQTTTLAQYFERAGYYTGLLANQPAIAGAGYTKGFQEIDVMRADQPRDDARLVSRTVEFMEDAGEDRIFLYVHFAGPLTIERNEGQGIEDAAAAAQAYDAAVRAADEQLRALVGAVEAADGSRRTLIVVTSLHGFELFDHGGFGSGWTLFEESLRVPLVLVAEDLNALAPIPAPVGLVDMMPSLLTLTGIEMDDAPREGASFVAPLGDGLRLTRIQSPRIAELVIPERCILRSVTHDRLKYIASSLWTTPEARNSVAQAHQETSNAYLSGETPLPPLWGAEQYEALFELGADPGESLDLLLRYPDRGEALKSALEAYRARCAESGIAPRIATQFQSAPDEETLQNLESLGYL